MQKNRISVHTILIFALLEKACRFDEALHHFAIIIQGSDYAHNPHNFYCFHPFVGQITKEM